MKNIKLLDCTLRDGGYYNSWDFDNNMIEEYLNAMQEISIDYVEIGLRSFNNNEYKGACAYSTDNFIRSLSIPDGLKLGVMVNASELIKHSHGIEGATNALFSQAKDSPITLVRIACHLEELEKALPAVTLLKEKGYLVGINLMQIAGRTPKQIHKLALLANEYPLDVLYFADSLGGLNPDETSKIIQVIREAWTGPLGVHTHDNMGLALANSVRAVEEGVTWIDSTVTGMGRGPGNAKTEYLAIELDSQRKKPLNIIPLMEVIKNYFESMQITYGWGTNTYYYLSGKYGIHPTYIQEMISDIRYNGEDILAVIEQLKVQGAKSFSINTLEAARSFYKQKPSGKWSPSKEILGKEVLVLGTGPSLNKHQNAIEEYIKKNNPFVIALNTSTQISSELINVRAASHPVRILADSAIHMKLPQPVIIPLSMTTDEVRQAYFNKNVLDFGIKIEENTFKFNNKYATLPSPLVLAYSLAISASGGATRILLAGFDGYGVGDPRTEEVNDILYCFEQVKESPMLLSITPTQYKVASTSIYAI